MNKMRMRMKMGYKQGGSHPREDEILKRRIVPEDVWDRALQLGAPATKHSMCLLYTFVLRKPNLLKCYSSGQRMLYIKKTSIASPKTCKKKKKGKKLTWSRSG
jgi:hypothetical protein